MAKPLALYFKNIVSENNYAFTYRLCENPGKTFLDVGRKYLKPPRKNAKYIGRQKEIKQAADHSVAQPKGLWLNRTKDLARRYVTDLINKLRSREVIEIGG